MKSVKAKFESLIRTLNYDCVKLLNINAYKLEQWAIKTIPEVVKEIKDNGWDLTNDDTWLENTFTTNVLQWYGKRIAVFTTASEYEFRLCQKAISSKEFRNLRETLNFDCHLALLVHPVIFLEPTDLDDIFVSLDFDRGWSAIDYSHFDDEENLDDAYRPDWGWLEYNEESDYEWTTDQVVQAYNETIYKYSE